MREIDYTDARGRMWRVKLPDGVPDEDAALGILVGPMPIVDTLNICEPTATRLHNELHRRGLFRLRDVQRKPSEVHAALMAALRLDAQTIEAEYQSLERL